MSARWSAQLHFQELILPVPEQLCPHCGRMLGVRKARRRFIYRFAGPHKLVCPLVCCPDKHCPGHQALVGPDTEHLIALPRWRIDWDVFLWMGFRRFKRHWDVPQLRAELADSYEIRLSTECITAYLRKYQVMVAAWHQDEARVREVYVECPDLILTIDGIQPEKGHETLYVVRELRQHRVWFAESLLSSSTAEIQQLIHRAKQIVRRLGKPVRGWVTDKQDAFVVAIAAEFPGTVHRYCANHFLRDAAQLVTELDSHLKVQMRKKIRGLRTLEKTILSTVEQGPGEHSILTQEQRQYAAQIVLDYCAATRGILNDNHGGPLRPAGWRMVEALEELHQSLGRNLQQPPTPISPYLQRLASYIQRGLALYTPEQPRMAAYLQQLEQIWSVVLPGTRSLEQRITTFHGLIQQFEEQDDPIVQHMSQVMQSFETGLFVGGDDLDIPVDNLDLERWIKQPKRHERHLHGRHHVGLRMVYEGPTLLPALDAHLVRRRPFTVRDLLPYATAEVPESQQEAVERHRIMRKARSKKNETPY